jgi:peptidyl-dipeptidase Dcp
MAGRINGPKKVLGVSCVKTGKFLGGAVALMLSGVAMAAVAEAKTVKSAAAEPAFLQPWAGPYEGVPPWDQVKVSEFPAAFQAAMDSSQAEFEAMLSADAPITYENTIIASELAGQKIDRLFSVWGVHSSNLSNDDIRKIQGEWEPKISEFFSKMSLDARNFQRVKYLYDTRAQLNLDAKQLRLLERTYDSMVRNGALLNAAKKAEVIAIETDLAKRFSEFSNKVLADEETYILIADEAELAGLRSSRSSKIRPIGPCAKKSGAHLPGEAITTMPMTPPPQSPRY